MAKRSLKKEINEISKITRNIPTLMETIHFSPEREREMTLPEEDEYEDMPMDEPTSPMSEPSMPEPQKDVQPELGVEAPMEGKEVVDQIRKMALKAMADLADNTEDSYYSVLKKIWQMADKNPEDEKNKKVE